MNLLCSSKMAPDLRAVGRPRFGDKCPSLGSPVAGGRLRKTDHSVQMLHKDYWEVVDRETTERYWAVAPKLKSIRPALDWRRIWLKAAEETAPDLSIIRRVTSRRIE